MSTTPFLTAGRICLSLVALSTPITCYLADFSETHVKNPRWPPHARFHDGQTMSMGLVLGLLTFYFTWRPTIKTAVSTDAPRADSKPPGDTKSGTKYQPPHDPLDSTFCAALVGSVYWVTGLSGILYPGTKFMDPEFGSGAPQVPIFTAHLVLVWVGYWLEKRRLSSASVTGG